MYKDFFRGAKVFAVYPDYGSIWGEKAQGDKPMKLLFLIPFLFIACGSEENQSKPQAYNGKAELIELDNSRPNCEENSANLVIYSQETQQYYVCISNEWHLLIMSPDGNEVSEIE